MGEEEDSERHAPAIGAAPAGSKDAPSFKGRPTIELWALESMRRSLKTLTGSQGSIRRRVVIALSYLAMFFLGMYAHERLFTPPRVETRLGVLAIHSVPEGAVVWINGQVLDAEPPGNSIRTPVPAITNLKYGADYTIRLEKRGFRPWEKSVRMSAEVDGRRIEAELEPE